MAHRDAIIEACQILAAQEHLKATITGSIKGAAVTGVSAFAGSLLGGPIGLLIGSTLASGIYAYYTRGSYRPVCDIIKNDLTPAQKQQLAASVMTVLSNIKAENVMTLVALITAQSSVKEAVVKEIGGFLLRELKMSIS